MTQAKSHTLMLVLAILCLTSLSSRSLQDEARTATPSPDPAYGNCPAPTQSGVNVCAPLKFQGPTYLASRFQVIGSATGGRGEVKAVQVWVDGSKLLEAGGNVFNHPITLPSGNHALTLVELDSTGFSVQSDPIQIQIQGGGNQPCAPPSTPGVNVCLPSGCHTAPWSTIAAAGTGDNAVVVRMELWVDNAKIANFPGNRINTNLFLQDYSVATIVEVDSKGEFVKSAPFVILSC